MTPDNQSKPINPPANTQPQPASINPLDPAAIPAPPIGTPPVDLPTGPAPTPAPAPLSQPAPFQNSDPVTLPSVSSAPSPEELTAEVANLTGTSAELDSPSVDVPETLDEMVRDLDRTITNAVLDLIPKEQFISRQAAVHEQLGKAFSGLSKIEGKANEGAEQHHVSEARGKVSLLESVVNHLTQG